MSIRNYLAGNSGGGQVTPNSLQSNLRSGASHPGQSVDRINPFLKQDQAAKKKGRQDYDIDQRTDAAEQAANQKLGTADTAHYDDIKGYVEGYKTNQGANVKQLEELLSGLISQSQGQAKDAQTTYSNDILPALQNALGKHKTNADSAMTLNEAMDPNNKLATSIRDLYDNLGQRERQRGQQDYGVLSALGAQAAGQQFGQLPMTSGQMGQIYGRNQAQAGDAYARAQNRMYDLQQQGITRGFEDTKHWYDKGQQSIDKYGQSAKDIQSASMNHNDLMGKLRGEQSTYGGSMYDARGGYNQDMLTLGTGMADMQKQNAYAGTGRESQQQLSSLGREQERTDSQYERDMEKNKANAVLFGKSLEGAGTMGGFATGMFSGGGAMASDRRVKTQIGDIKRNQLKEFFSAIKPKKYKYKNPNTAITRPGQRYGFMMQDVQNTQLGKQITQKMPDGTLAYDRDNLQGILVAALADNYRGKLKPGRRVGR